MSAALFTQNLKESRRDALVNHYIAKHNFGTYNDKINNANDLYEYLLLDTKISDSVTTSPLSEAVSSLQLFIHRAMEGYDGELASNNEVNGWFAQDAFLDNWDRYNKRYSTWAGKEKLRFYAGNYTDPTLRANKTVLFKELENQLNQGKLTTSLVENALRNFISDCDRYTGMEYLCAGLGNGTGTRLYFTGCLNEQYYWREVLLDQSANNTNCKPVYWGEWHPLPAAVKDPWQGRVVMTYRRDGAQCQWADYEKGELYSWQMRRNSCWELSEITPLWRWAWTSSLGSVDADSKAGKYNWSLDHDAVCGYFLLNHKNRDEIIVGVESVSPDHFGVYYKDNGLNEVKLNGQRTFKLDSNEVSLYCIHNHPMNFSHRLSATCEMVLDRGLLPSSWGTFSTDGGKVWLMKDGNKRFTVTASSVSGTLGAWLEQGIATLLNYDNQVLTVDKGAWYWGGATSNKGDAFSGPYGLYLWEIFFHLPFLVATRFATEQRFDEAERWYKYIFNSAGYRDEDGKLIMGEDGKTPRYWNCYPLQQDTEWDALADMPACTDPDVIATADPMHYKLAIFQHTLDLLIARGDAAYRMLERDTLAQAKMYYVQAQQLLGPRPDIRITNSWNNPTLEQAAGDIDKPATRDGLPQTFAQWLRAGDRNEMGDGDFLPAYNDVLLAYWDKLDIRLFNLRHNLSLNGQPLDLPLFATPADPKELHRQQSGGDGAQGNVSPANDMDTGWRYPLLADHARNAASQLSQFGSSLLNALERRDSEQLTLLLQTQQIAVLDQQQDIAQKNLDSLGATLTSLNASLASARLRKNHYTQLFNGNLSAQEQQGLTLRTESRGQTLASQALAIAGGALSALPNTFGLANGGGDFGAPLKAAAQVMQMVATANEQSAVISDISAGYQRRTEEWSLQRDLAGKDVEQMQAQIDSLNAQIAMQQKQIRLTEMESANAQALYELQSSRFTGQALYNWMVGRLSALHYQLYDNTVPVCLQARKALTRELGSDKADGLFNTPVWNDLYQGLLAGEGLISELQKLNNVWLQYSALGLEATRTVSLATLRGEESGSLSTVIDKVLLGTEDESTLGKLTFKDGIFSAVLDLSKLGLDSAYNDSTRRRFIKSISVTLPTLLGPYQDIEASLSGGGQMATLSHGMQDAGRFVTNFDDSRFLPFEGMELKKNVETPLTLSIFNVKGRDEAEPNQRAMVENLSDIIFHIHYIMR